MNNNIISRLRYIGIFFSFMLLVSTISAFNFQVLSTNPAPIQAGSYADVTIRIDTRFDDSTSTIDNLNVKIKETDFIKPVPGQDLLISLNSGQTITRTFRVYFSSSIPTGEIPLSLIYELDGQKLERTQNIFVSAIKKNPELFIGEIKSIPNKLLQDTKSNTINIVLQNLGEKDAQLINAKLKVDNSLIEESYSFSLEDSLASISDGDQQTLSFTFDIKETSSLQIPAILQLRYRVFNEFDNSYDIINEEIEFEIRLSDSPRYEIVNIEKLNTFIAGTSNNELRITIKNVGGLEGKSTRLRLYPDPSQPFDFELTSIFITSSIKPQETFSFIVPLDITDDALVQNYFINADIESLVGDNRYSQNQRLQIQVDEPVSNSLGIYMITLIIVSLSIAIFIGVFFNRKKKVNKK